MTKPGEHNKASERSDAVRALGQLPKPVQQYLESTLGKLDGAILSGDLDAAWQVAERSLQLETAGKILAGAAFKRLRGELAPLEFTKGLVERNIARSTAYDAISIADLFSSFPSVGVVRALGQLGPTKAMALRHLKPDEFEALAAGKPVHGLTLDAASEMSSRELQQAALASDHEVTTLRRKVTQLETETETAQANYDRLKAQLASQFDNLQMPIFAAEARAEVAALTEKALLCIEQLAELVSSHIVGKRSEPDAQRFQRIVAGTLYHCLIPVGARVHDVCDQLYKSFGKEVTEVRYEFQLKKDESKHYVRQRSAILEQAANEKHNRAVARESADAAVSGKRGRGRPLKAKQ